MTVKIGRTVNKGEWAEIYVFLKLVADRLLASADADYNPIPEKNFKVQKIVREEGSARTKVKTIYDLTQGPDETVVDVNGVTRVVGLDDLKNGVKIIFEKILAGTGTFNIPEAEKYMLDYGCTSLKAKSGDKSDIFLVLHDSFSKMDLSTGFSIKTSLKKSKATLLNTSKKNTNFIYEVISDPEGLVPANKVREAVKYVYGAGKKLRFSSMEGEIFRKNLRKIDGNLPEIIAVMLKKYYLHEAADLADLATLLPDDPDLRHLEFSAADYEYKIKAFLEAVALGMVPKKEWNGNASANGGYIVVKKSGELVCFHRYYRDQFLDYLFKKTFFDTPDPGRHEFGEIYTEDGKEMIKLNIQIRFR